MESQKLIDANDKSVSAVLDKIKYTIDVFQREYKWGTKQIDQLITDLTSKFLSHYKSSHDRREVSRYPKYYLGSLVVCMKDGKRSIVDGQQRLSSLTLLLIYLNNLQKNSQEDKVAIDNLIFSEKFGEKSFNLQVEDREDCIGSLYETGNFNSETSGESVKNIVERYHDIEELFPVEIKNGALPFFIDWVLENVIFVEILTLSDDDAYTIFETMNDRGLNLTSAEMLKGYLISNLGSQEEKIKLNELWKERILKLKEIDKDEDLEFFKAWLRSKYADSIRQGKRGSENEDFEKIGTRFHSWVRDNKEKIGLNSKKDFSNFIESEFDFYSNLYIKMNEYSRNLTQDVEWVYYLSKARASFSGTFIYPLLMAPVKTSDTEKIINKKLALVAKYMEMFIVFRSVNSRTLGYSAIRYTMFSMVKEIRDKNVEELSKILKKKVKEFTEDLSGISKLELGSQNKRFFHFLLARITKYIEEKSCVPSKFEDYINPELKKPFEVEHIWSDKFEEHRDEFEQRDEWEGYRNKLGDLLLLQRGFNQSYGALPFYKKLPHYFGQNLLAKSLNEKCYEMNPSFASFIEESKLKFKPYSEFKKKDILERQELYKKICEQIYNIEEFDTIVNN